MSTENNKTIVRRLYEEAVNQGNLAVLDELLSDNIITHTTVPGIAPNRAGFRQFLSGFLSAFPIQHTELHEMIAEGDRVAVLHSHHATHGGDFMGLPASGKDVNIAGIEIFRLANGRITEMWHGDDMLSLFQQLGLIPVAG